MESRHASWNMDAFKGSKSELSYQSHQGSANCADYKTDSVALGHGRFLCEMVLFVAWAHRGRAQANFESLVYLLDPDSFVEVVMNNAAAHARAYKYAVTVLQKVTDEMEDHEVHDLFTLTDIDASAFVFAPSRTQSDARLVPTL